MTRVAGAGKVRYRITRAFVENATAGDRPQRAFFDEALPGFGLLVGKRAKSFFVQHEVHGITKRFKIGRYGVLTIEQARKEARQRLAEMDRGIDPKAEQRKVTKG